MKRLKIIKGTLKLDISVAPEKVRFGINTNKLSFGQCSHVLNLSRGAVTIKILVTFKTKRISVVSGEKLLHIRAGSTGTLPKQRCKTAKQRNNGVQQI